MPSAARRLTNTADPEARLVEALGLPYPPLSASLYGAAIIELCARVWLELERLVQLCARGDARCLTLAAATLRLELLVLSDASDAPLSRSTLSAAQRAHFRSLLGDVLDAIDFEPDALAASDLDHAQDRLFDEVIVQYSAAAGGSAADRLDHLDGGALTRR